MKISSLLKSYTIKASFIFVLISFIVGTPIQASAGFFDFLMGKSTQAAEVVPDDFGTDSFPGNSKNLQNMDLLESSIDPDMKNINDCSNLTMDEGALMTSTCDTVGSGLESDSRGEMTVYTVKEGDTLSEIASLFDVSINTIKWENNLNGQSIKVGQKLNILPVTGVKHIVKKGDTIEKIALKYDAEAQDIMVFNDIAKNSELKQGDILYIPNGVIKPVVVVEKTPTKKPISNNTTEVPSTTPATPGYYVRPAEGRITSPYGSRKRGFHYGIDIGNVRGTPVVAAAEGIVLQTLGSCVEGRKSCGGRYGNYILIEHPNGTTTRYAHLSKVMVSVGESVSQGERIGSVGNTGRSTGPHLHYEVEKANGSKARPVF